MEIPFDLVAEVTCLASLFLANSKAYSNTRSTPVLVITVSWTTNSLSVPSNIRPPIELYSPSVFSRTIQKSISPGLRPANGEGTPGIKRTGRRLIYWSKARLNCNNDPQREI